MNASPRTTARETARATLWPIAAAIVVATINFGAWAVSTHPRAAVAPCYASQIDVDQLLAAAAARLRIEF